MKNGILMANFQKGHVTKESFAKINCRNALCYILLMYIQAETLAE
jgi:hypothetical protein